MRILFIDTSSANVTVAIIENDKIIYEYRKQILSDMSSKIMPIIDNGFSSTNFSIKDIDKIFVVNGPGSFTGVRIGVTIAKTIAWALKKDVIPISSLEYMASTSSDKKYIVPMIDARRNNVFSGIYDTDLNRVKDDSLFNITDIINIVDSNYKIVSYDNLKVDKSDPNPDVLKVISKHINDNPIEPHLLNPSYLKLTQAEEDKIKND